MSHAPTPQSLISPAIAWSDPARADQFASWLADATAQHGLQPDSLRLASADASFRRYFRIDAQDGSRIIMDAPPDKENSAPFVKVAALMHAAGVHAPQVLAWDEPLGFMLLTDLGAQTMMQVINRDEPQANLPLYLQAVDALIAWQLSSKPGVLPPYDDALLRRELALFPDWYITRHKGVVIDEAMRQTLDKTFDQIIGNNLSWPSVFVHRDFMPRNLMAGNTGTGTLGVLDFQDAVYGPITYDIASLMRDAFLSWDEDFCLDVTIRYWEKARKAGLPVGDDLGEFYRGVEWMGLQRHLKVAGIFARLTLRDGKPQYLADTPRFIAYIRTTCARYRELKPLLRLVEKVEGIEVPNVFGFGRQ
ncbi:aminoglycoside phosphotransferase family protein [Rhodoferax sp.]|uniref:aminoglycoside phosphotransferase family protein n=1 Tax=Rhodoferax sp. TaxID=50421 RepID=UPI0027266471|nr:phosphotransferase [Rhodoferax sp.]MDO8320744.1 phosphotransferase [Rhodoferax sp.]